jgi:2-dehydro-3-deoxy-D-arabinonate dehydratase
LKLYRLPGEIRVEHDAKMFSLATNDWDAFINRPQLHAAVLEDIAGLEPVLAHFRQEDVLKPVVGQEIWASGVTYMRSRTARMAESKKAGGGTFYDKVYEAERPELFFKSTAARAVGPYEKVRIRKDSGWDVPEPELTLFICSQGSIEGYTIGNDMSSRSIEGENPLYLPQAKTYTASAALGPCIYVPGHAISPDTEITLTIARQDNLVFSDRIGIHQMKRKIVDLVDYLFRECTFEQGVFLMTGTGIIPPDDFTLRCNDVVSITIDGIGTLVNTVA